MNKQQLRKWAKKERKKFDMETLSMKLVEKLKETTEYKKAKNIMIYYPKLDEINLLSLLDDKSKNFYLPKIQGDDLLCCPYKKGDELCLSCFNTKEPTSEAIKKTFIDLVIVPALAVDKNGYRLGYGGGFYDRFLAGMGENVCKIVCLPHRFIVETVFPEKHDIKIDKIVAI